MNKNLNAIMAAALSLVASLAVGVCVAHAGSEGSGGGSVVRDEHGKMVPADVYFKKRNYQLPSYYQRKLELSEFPGLTDELNKIYRLVTLRAQIAKPLKISLEDLEFYATTRFSGDDVLPVESGLTARQTAYTYSFHQVSEDFSLNKMRRIVEIKTSLFSKLSPRVQALIIFHEVLHHTGIGGHEIIAPMIGALLPIMAARDRQHAGDLSEISETEYKASIQFENLIQSAFSDCDPSAGPCRVIAPNPINRHGGGSISRLPQDQMSDQDQNYIGIDSSVATAIDVSGGLQRTYFQKNTVIDARPGIEAEQGCEENRFESIDTEAHLSFIACLRASGNTLKNIILYNGIEAGNAAGFTIGSRSAAATGNLISNLVIVGVQLGITGNGNVLTDDTISEFHFAAVGYQREPEIGSGIFLIVGNKSLIRNSEIGFSTQQDRPPTWGYLLGDRITIDRAHFDGEVTGLVALAAPGCVIEDQRSRDPQSICPATELPGPIR